MKEKTHDTPCGRIHYWANNRSSGGGPTLVFLPGLTADHRLFDPQIEYFYDKHSVLVWDAPGHASSWPFDLSFTLMDKAGWLKEIFAAEGIDHPVIIGQSMGGYVGQAFMQRFPGALKGFLSIDSAPLQKKYVTGPELWLLKRTEPIYRLYPWGALLKSGAKGCAVSPYGRQLMRDMMMVYDRDRSRYARLAGHGFRMLAAAIEADLPYEIDCPALLICGVRDQAGSTKRYNWAWHKAAGIPIQWVPEAGHNSNTDQPQLVNSMIETFLASLSAE